MKFTTPIVKALFIAVTGVMICSDGDAETPQTRLLKKDGEVIRVPARPEREFSEVDPTESYKLADPEGYQKNQANLKAYRESQGAPPGQWYFPPKTKRDPDKIETFEIPPDEMIPGCSYAAGASFPGHCNDEEPGGMPTENVIFRAGKDPQSVLDAIKKKHGITGEYNVMPEGYTADWTLWEKYEKGLPLIDPSTVEADPKPVKHRHVRKKKMADRLEEGIKTPE
jgi:hypothetical protein